MSKINILALKKEGEQERLRQEIGSLAYQCKNLCEAINWNEYKDSKKRIDAIKEKLVYIEDLFAELV
mgnify:CR=1 FL=1